MIVKIYKFEPYDVIAISTNFGDTWEDYTTLRTPDEAKYASEMVARNRDKRVRYRIERGPKTVMD